MNETRSEPQDAAIPSGLALVACALWGDAEANSKIRDAISDETRNDAVEVFGPWIEVWRAIENLEGAPVELASIGLKFRAEQLQAVSEAIGRVAPFTWREYVDRARSDRGWDRVRSAAAALGHAAEARSGDPESVLRGITESFEAAAAPSKAVTGKALADLFVNDIEARFKRRTEGRRSGTPTGLHGFDSMTDGLQAGELVVIGARPSAGKTALAVSMVSNLCLTENVPTAVLSLEMSASALARRLAAAHAGVKLKSIREGDLTEADFRRIHSFRCKLHKAPLHIVDDRRFERIDAALHEAARLIRKSGVRVVVVDYAQKLKASGRHEKRTYEVAECTGRLQEFAQRHKVSVVALAQLNREPDKDKGRLPRISDLADSAQIERDADVVGLIHRPRDSEHDGREAWLIVAKQRDGEVGPVRLYFNTDFARFENPSNE